MQTKEQAVQVIRRNIRKEVTKRKRVGMAGASVACLRQLVPTVGLSIDLSPSGYAALFAEVVAGMKFSGFEILS